MSDQIPPSGGVLKSLLELHPDAILVGGQSLAAWAAYYRLPLPAALVPVFSADVDFLGKAAVAEEIGRKLGGRVFRPSGEDPVNINTAVISLPQGTDHVRVDFLGVVAGLDEKDIRQRAMELEAWGARFRVMHPVDCLASRLENLRLLPEKRSAAGIAQTQVAVRIVREFIDEISRTGAERHALDLAEFVGKIAAGKAGLEALSLYRIDVLDAIPADRMQKEFQAKRWPRLRAYRDKKIAARRNATRSAPPRQFPPPKN